MRGRNHRVQNTEYRIQKSEVCYLSSVIRPLFFVLTLLFLCVFVPMFIGISCRPERISKDTRSPTERREAQLLKQLDLKFENPDVHYELGQLYQAKGKWAKAEYHYNVVLEFDPAHKPTQAALVKGLIKSGNTAKAEQYAKTYLNLASSSTTASLQLADAFDRQGLDEYAVASYQQALRLAPDSSEAYKQAGYYYLRKGDKAKAKDYLSRSFQINPNQPDVSGELGRLGIVVKIPRELGGNPVKTEPGKGKSSVK